MSAGVPIRLPTKHTKQHEKNTASEGSAFPIPTFVYFVCLVGKNSDSEPRPKKPP
jgi:hypothetical protein